MNTSGHSRGDGCRRAGDFVRRLVVCASLALSAATLALAPSSAGATQFHRFSKAVGSAGSGAGQLLLHTGDEANAGSGVAVNNETHDLYVADTANNRIAEFDASGTFVRAWGWGVATGAAEPQTCTVTCQAGSAGNSPGQLEAPTFVAVDNDPLSPSHGDVYVAGPGHAGQSPTNLVTKFDSQGKLLESWGVKGQLDGSIASEGPFGELAGIIVDTLGNLWVYTGENGGGRVHMFEFAETAAFLQGWAPAHVSTGVYSPQGIAIDSSADLYLSKNASAAEKVNSSGAWLGAVIKEEVTVAGLAVNTADNDLYVGDSGTTILDFPTCEPSLEPCIATQTFGAPQLSGAAGLAVDSSTGTVYAANTTADQVAVFATAIEAVSLAPSEVKADSAVLHGEVNPEGSELTRCRFEYGETVTNAYSASVPCEETPGEIGTGTSRVKVNAPVSLLRGGTGYHLRLRTTNANGDVRSAAQEFTTSTTAIVEEASAVEEGPSSARLTAKINPKGLTAGYHFEYDTVPYTSGGPAHGISVPVPDETIGSGNTGVDVSQQIAGLSPNTTYYFRVVATDVNGAAASSGHTFVLGIENLPQACGNERLREESATDPSTGKSLSLGLPDCRAYELITPPQKNAALLTPITFGLPIQISDEGSEVIGSVLQCFSDSQSCTGDRVSKGPPFAFDRTSGGWLPRPLAPPASAFEINSVWGYDANTGTVLYSSPTPSHGTEEFYAREPDGTMQGIGPIAESLPLSLSIFASPVFATDDLSHVVYESNNLPLWPSFEKGEGQSLYAYAGVGSATPTLVGVSGGAGSTSLISACGTNLGSSKARATTEALSGDGHTIYFTAAACAKGTGVNSATPVPVNALYARVDGELPDARTEAISASQCGSGAQPGEKSCREAEAQPRAAFLEGVSKDGSKAVFTSTQQLTDTASQDSRALDSATGNACPSTSGPNGCNLYLYDFADPSGKRRIDVSAGDSSGLGPQVQGVMAISDDGSHVYFVAKGVLSTGANAAGQEAVEGANNLYVYTGGQTTFIATLPGTAKSPPRNEPAESTEWTGRSGPAANVTPDGRFLVFTSHGVLTPDTTRPEGPAQVFRYDAQSKELARVSIGQQGFNDNGNSSGGEARVAIPREGHVGWMRHDPTMSDDGSYVFFQSPAALVPGALDDVALNSHGESIDLAQNVYEWEAQGNGDCTQASGCVHLISDGRDASEGLKSVEFATASSVELIGSDTTGENVFFTTADPLVGQDTDTQLDYYDARVNGGFSAPPKAISCAGEECRPPASAPPTFEALGSTTFSGAGNLVPVLGGPLPKPQPKPLTRAQKLAKALKLCRTKHSKKKREVCERQARKRYGPNHKAKAKRKAHRGAKGKRK